MQPDRGLNAARCCNSRVDSAALGDALWTSDEFSQLVCALAPFATAGIGNRSISGSGRRRSLGVRTVNAPCTVRVFGPAENSLRCGMSGARSGCLSGGRIRQIRPREREPNQPLEPRHLSEFSAGPENSHGASGVKDRTSTDRCRPTPKPANEADLRRCERHQRHTQCERRQCDAQRNGGRVPEPLVPASSGFDASIRLHAPCVSSGAICSLYLSAVLPARSRRSGAVPKVGVWSSFPRPCLPFRARKRAPNPGLGSARQTRLVARKRAARQEQTK